ncbi:MAG: heat-inducible transcription repressor HrcA [Chloroflexi bacterium]|nr:MAG: heat-inducible transcription repressor HrcA [Chloroflexota bacterium]
MIELTERRKEILAIVVREYIATAAPVGSTTIAKVHDLGVSPATIRNEMAALEEAGYLTHPHTSAGRLPTVKGYRYFVEQLMETSSLPPREQRMIREKFDAAGWEPEAWMHLSASVLAQVTHAASLVTAPKPSRSQFKHLELVELRDGLVLLVLVLADGSVEQVRFQLPEARSQEELSALADQLNERLAGLDRHAIAKASLPTIAPVPQVVDRVLELMAEVDRRHGGQLVHAGLEHVLSQPEFANAERATEVVQVFERREPLWPILADVAWSHRGVRIIIAGEDRWDAISDYGLVLADYGAADTRGTVGVLGPIRMPYERAVSVVEYVSGLMSRLLRELYGVA